MTPEQQEANTTMVSVSPPKLHDAPTAYLNPGDGTPFAVVELSTRMWLYIHEAAHARAIAAAFTKAADLMDAAAQEQPPPDAGDSSPEGGAS